MWAEIKQYSIKKIVRINSSIKIRTAKYNFTEKGHESCS